MNAKKKWNRMARFYDIWSAPMEMMGAKKWRLMLFSEIPEGNILEIGVGTGINTEYYPNENREYTAIDISPKMLEKAKARAEKNDKTVDLIEMNVESMQFPSKSFDAVAATCVFCSVPDPVQGLREARRVLKKDGMALFIEHMRPGGRVLGKIFDIMNHATSRLIGFNINRRTAENIRKAGFEIIEERYLFRDIFRFIKAKPV
jgi:ubiquinone/menaquinone biosynthesis C-methylase UbiE